MTVANSLNAVSAETTGFEVVDAHSVSLRFQVSAPGGPIDRVRARGPGRGARRGGLAGRRVPRLGPARPGVPRVDPDDRGGDHGFGQRLLGDVVCRHCSRSHALAGAGAFDISTTPRRPKESDVSSDAPVTFLTQDAYDRLAAELEHLSTTGREEIAKRIESAREEGDLKENGGYHAAKDEQGKQEARIRTLQHLLKNATVSEAPESTGVVEPGTVDHGDRRRRRRGLPARQPRDRRRLRAGRLQRGVAARRRHPRPQRGREDVLHRAERPRDQRRDRQGRDLQRPVTARRPGRRVSRAPRSACSPPPRARR